MKILMINSVCGIRSTGRICTDIAEELERDGHECRIAYGRETVPVDKQKYAVRIGSDFGVKLHAGLSRIFDRSGFYSRHATKRFLMWVDEYQPDVVHLHNLHGYFIDVAALCKYLKKKNIPVVWTLHDQWAFTGHAAYCDAVGCDKWRTKCFNCPQKKKYPKSKVFDRSKSNYERKKRAFCGLKNMTIVTPSTWLKQLVGQSFLGSYPVRVIYNGIDKDAFKSVKSDFRERYCLNGCKIVLGVASEWDERKGLNDFIRLSKMLGEDHKIVLVGVNAAQRNSLPDGIVAIERTNSVWELAEIYSAADVFFNPTYEDNYPTVNLEAQACGTPVLTYRTGGSPESVPAENVVEKGDLGAVIRLINKPLQVCDDLQDRGNMVAEYIQIYQNLTKV